MNRRLQCAHRRRWWIVEFTRIIDTEDSGRNSGIPRPADGWTIVAQTFIDSLGVILRMPRCGRMTESARAFEQMKAETQWARIAEVS